MCVLFWSDFNKSDLLNFKKLAKIIQLLIEYLMFLELCVVACNDIDKKDKRGAI